MKYSSSVKAILLASINELADNPVLYAKHPGRDFTRNRKLGFKDFLILLLTMEAECIKEELYRYFGRETSAPSKAAFCKQRSKLRQDALRSLLFAFNAKLKRNLYVTMENTSSLPAMGLPVISLGTRKIPILSLSRMGNRRGGVTRSISMHFFRFLTGALQTFSSSLD